MKLLDDELAEIIYLNDVEAAERIIQGYEPVVSTTAIVVK